MALENHDQAMTALGLGPTEPDDLPLIEELRQERAEHHDDDLARVTWERDQLREALLASLITVETYAEELLHERGAVACRCPEWPAFEDLKEEPQTGGWDENCLLHGYPPRVLKDAQRLLEITS